MVPSTATAAAMPFGYNDHSGALSRNSKQQRLLAWTARRCLLTATIAAVGPALDLRAAAALHDRDGPGMPSVMAAGGGCLAGCGGTLGYNGKQRRPRPQRT